MDENWLRSQLERRGYAVIKLLAKGGFGRVYLAILVREAGFRLPYAIKVFTPRHDLPPETQKVTERHFIEEARVLAGFEHDNIVMVRDFFRLGAIRCLVMDYVEGLTLETLLAWRGSSSHTSLSEITALTLMLQAAQGLAYAHGASDRRGHPLGLLHRDIKPANLMLSRSGRLMLLDFGIASTRSMGVNTLAAGTPRYMSPEQSIGYSLTPASDLYSLGMVFYELLTLEPLIPPGSPSDSPSVQQQWQLRAAAELDAHPMLHALAQRLPESAALLEMLLRRDPHSRLQHAGELVERLEKVLARAARPVNLERFYLTECKSMADAGRSELLPLTRSAVLASLPNTEWLPPAEEPPALERTLNVSSDTVVTPSSDPLPSRRDVPVLPTRRQALGRALWVAGIVVALAVTGVTWRYGFRSIEKTEGTPTPVSGTVAETHVTPSPRVEPPWAPTATPKPTKHKRHPQATTTPRPDAVLKPPPLPRPFPGSACSTRPSSQDKGRLEVGFATNPRLGQSLRLLCDGQEVDDATRDGSARYKLLKAGTYVLEFDWREENTHQSRRCSVQIQAGQTYRLSSPDGSGCRG